MTIAFVFIFGLCIGSFLNVAIYRMPRKLSVMEPRRSFCPECGTQLLWWENIPVLSWIFLRGKCRTCGAAISVRYPFVELLSGAAALAALVRYDLTPTGFVVFAVSAALIVIIFTDLDFKMIPNLITYPGMTIGLLLGIVSQYTDLFAWPVTAGAMDTLLGFLCGGGFFWVVGQGYYLVTKRWGLGWGDIKLLAMTGAILGVSSVIPTILIGSICGSVVGIGLILFAGGGRTTEIPFGPWLALGVFLYMFGVQLPIAGL